MGHSRSSAMSPFDRAQFRGDLWLQKTRVLRLSRDVVCVILRLAVLDRQTDGNRAMASTADA